jgi:hypothetical protein
MPIPLTASAPNSQYFASIPILVAQRPVTIGPAAIARC